jgi:Tol biopolymer transport system component
METLAPKNRVIGGIDWGSEGKELVFSARRYRDFRLWTIRNHKMAPHAAGLFADNPIQFSLRASRLAYTVSNQNPNIWRLQLADGSWQPWAASTGEDSAPQAAPDGKQIAFVSDRSGQEQLWQADSEGRDVRQLTTGDLLPALGRWSPKADSIVFNASVPTTHLLTVANGVIRPIQVQPRISLCAVSPDGRTVIGTVTENGRRQLIQAPIEGGTVKFLAEGGFYAQYSRDGDWIYFVKDREGRTLWRLPATGGAPEAVIEETGLAGFGMWALGKDHLYQVARRPGHSGWWVSKRPFAGGPVAYIAPQKGDLPPFGAGYLTLAPDEKHLWTVWANAGSNDLLEATPGR